MMRKIVVIVLILLVTGCDSRSTNGLIPIITANPCEMECPARHGEYYPGEKILIRRDIKGRKREAILLHEFGHLVVDMGNRDPCVARAVVRALESVDADDFRTGCSEHQLGEW